MHRCGFGSQSGLQNANHEFHETGVEVNDTARQIVGKLPGDDSRTVQPPMAFPMQMDRFPVKMWAASLSIAPTKTDKFQRGVSFQLAIVAEQTLEA